METQLTIAVLTIIITLALLAIAETAFPKVKGRKPDSLKTFLILAASITAFVCVCTTILVEITALISTISIFVADTCALVSSSKD